METTTAKSTPMSAEESLRTMRKVAAMRLDEAHQSVTSLPGALCRTCLKPWPCDTYIAAQAVLDQRVLGQVAAALEGIMEAPSAGYFFAKRALALPLVQEALATWRKEQGQ